MTTDIDDAVRGLAELAEAAAEDLERGWPSKAATKMRSVVAAIRSLTPPASNKDGLATAIREAQSRPGLPELDALRSPQRLWTWSCWQQSRRPEPAAGASPTGVDLEALEEEAERMWLFAIRDDMHKLIVPSEVRGLVQSIRSLVATLRARPAQPSVPEGWKLVPVDPTRDMLEAAPTSADGTIDDLHAAIYRAMLAASPATEGGGK